MTMEIHAKLGFASKKTFNKFFAILNFITRIHQLFDLKQLDCF